MSALQDALPPDLARELAALVVKDGVRPGGLARRELLLALAWVCAGLPVAQGLDERAVNDALRAQLGGAAAWLDADHVELRRWLVDAGFLVRDGFGREYRRVDPSALVEPQATLARALGALDTAAWVRAQRARHAQQRERRHAEWRARQQEGRA